MKRIWENRKFDLREETSIALCVDFVEEKLKQAGLNTKLLIKTMLLTEECASMLRKHSKGRGELRVRIRKRLGDLSVSLSASGEKFDPYVEEIQVSGDIEEEDAQDAIRSILLKAYGEQFKYSHRYGENNFRLLAGQSGKKTLWVTLIALLSGLGAGLLLKCLPSQWGEFSNTYFLDPVKTMFMNALKIIIAPVVFFSIATCISTFKNLAELGRIGAKVMAMYLCTTVFAVFLGIGVFHVISPGRTGMAFSGGMTEAVGINTNVDTSVLSTIVNIVPDNFFRPFAESNTLQLIFLGAIVGFAVGMMGKFSDWMRESLEALNSLFLTVTMIITKVIPLAVFCSMAQMLLQLDSGSILSVLGVGGTTILALFLMLIVYGLLVFVLGRRNPITFFRKIREGMLTSFSLSSSSAAMPTNLRICKEKLGISPKIYSFSIPLGATLNMDGSCICLAIMGLFLAKVFGVTITESMLVSLIITIVLLSLGTPGVPGAGTVCLGVVLNQIGVPLSALSVVIPILTFLDMFVTMSNTTGDMAVTTIVASSEKLLDVETYNRIEG